MTGFAADNKEPKQNTHRYFRQNGHRVKSTMFWPRIWQSIVGVSGEMRTRWAKPCTSSFLVRRNRSATTDTTRPREKPGPFGIVSLTMLLLPEPRAGFLCRRMSGGCVAAIQEGGMELPTPYFRSRKPKKSLQSLSRRSRLPVSLKAIISVYSRMIPV